MNSIQESKVPEDYFPVAMTLSQISDEPDYDVQICLLIMYSSRTSAWEKNFAKEHAYKQIWRLQHHWIVSADDAHPSEKVFKLLKKICRDKMLDQIDLTQYH